MANLSIGPFTLNPDNQHGLDVNLFLEGIRLEFNPKGISHSLGTMTLAVNCGSEPGTFQIQASCPEAARIWVKWYGQSSGSSSSDPNPPANQATPYSDPSGNMVAECATFYAPTNISYGDYALIVVYVWVLYSNNPTLASQTGTLITSTCSSPSSSGTPSSSGYPSSSALGSGTCGWDDYSSENTRKDRSSVKGAGTRDKPKGKKNAIKKRTRS